MNKAKLGEQLKAERGRAARGKEVQNKAGKPELTCLKLTCDVSARQENPR